MRDEVQVLVDNQAEDEGLWFLNATASEAYLQQALRRLHAVIEAEPPCACGGREARAKARGTVWVWPTGPPYLYNIEAGNLELVPGLGADAGGRSQGVDILVFDALPAEETT